jgi:WD40 repeat protein
MKRQSRRRRSHILSNQGWEKVKDAIWQRLKKCPDEYNFTELSEQTTLPESKPLDPETVSKILRREEGADLRSIKRLFGAFGQELEKSDYTCPPQSNSETYHLNEAIPAPLGKLSGYMPSQPLNFLPRPDEFEAIKTAVLVSTNQSVAVAGTAHRVGVQGMGGIGKSVLTAEIARDEEVRRAFPDGVLWVTLGQTPMLTSWQSHLAEVLGAGQRTFTDVQLGKAFLGELLADKACLLILDDVWQTKHAAAFDALGQRCKMLLTTRDRGLITALGAVEYQLGVLSNEQSLALLALWAGQNEETLPTEAHEVVRECGNLPLALAMIGAMVRGKPDRWGNVLHKLRNADLEKIRYQFPHYLYSDLLKAIQVSVEDLEPDEQRRYLDLAVFPEDTPIPEATLQTFWEPEGLDKYETQDVVELLVERSLARRDDKGHLSLHDLQYDYVRKQAGHLPALHNQLLIAYAARCSNDWRTGPNDGYFFEHLPYHLVEAGRKEELRELLFNFHWLQVKLDATDVTTLITDYDVLPDAANVCLVQGALRLSAHILAQDKTQLAEQLLGRLLSYEIPKIQVLLEQAKEGKAAPWLRPLTSSMTPPGGLLLRTLTTHNQGIDAVALMPDGRRAISASRDATLQVWDLESGLLKITLRGHTDWVRAVAVTPDGQRAISGSHDQTLKVWNLENETELITLSGHTDSVNAMAVTPDGQRIVSVAGSIDSSNSTLKVWDLDSGSEQLTIDISIGYVWALAVTPDGQQAIAALDNHTLQAWNLESGEALLTLSGHDEPVYAVAVTPDGQRVASGSAEGIVKVWNLENGMELLTLQGHTDNIIALRVTPDGQYLVSGSSDKSLKVWDLASGTELFTLRGHTNEVSDVTVTPDSQYVVSASFDGTLKVWDLRRAMEEQAIRSHTDTVNAIVVTPDGQRAISASSDRTLKVWDLESGAELLTFQGHRSGVNTVAVTPNGQYIMSAPGSGSVLNDYTLRVWELDSGAEKFSIQDPCFALYPKVVATPDGQRLVCTSCLDNMLKVWDLETGVEVLTLQSHTNAVFAVAVTSDSQRAISASWDNTLKVWDLKSGEELLTLCGHIEPVWAVAVTHDDQYAISASRDGTLKVWDLECGEQKLTIHDNSEGISAIALTPNNQQVLCVSNDHTLKVRDLHSGEVIANFIGESELTACAIAPDGVTVAVGEASGRVHFLRLEGV